MFSKEFKDSLVPLPRGTKQHAMRAIQRIMQGKRGKVGTKPQAVEVPRHADVIHVEGMRHLRLVWSVDVEREDNSTRQVR